MDNEAYNAICNILNHELREQDHAVLAERIRTCNRRVARRLCPVV